MWKKLLTYRAVVIALFFCFIISCSDTERFKVLSYFFDGVPLPEEMYSDPNSPYYLNERFKTVRYVHEPRKKRECESCHGARNKGKRVPSLGETKLVFPVPKLCYQCHEEFIDLVNEKVVHGPFGLGECLYCHGHHDAPYPKLLKRPIPELCFRCHTTETIVDVKHLGPSYRKCTQCHFPHAGPKEYLLQDSLPDVKEQE
ncbi:MAG: hypothetical protein FVQ84_08220 [Planctomycetes bacterium]|nr:hypothetical protein [Planctomycetota bacterium]